MKSVKVLLPELIAMRVSSHLQVLEVKTKLLHFPLKQMGLLITLLYICDSVTSSPPYDTSSSITDTSTNSATPSCVQGRGRGCIERECLVLGVERGKKREEWTWTNFTSTNMYWSTNPLLEHPWFHTILSRNRFKQILGFLHLNDNTKQALHKDDKLFKVRPLVDILLKSFKTHFSP